MSERTQELDHDRIEQATVLLAANAMGIAQLASVYEMFPDLFDFGHGDVFEDLCRHVEERFGIPPITAEDLEPVAEDGCTVASFVEMLERLIARTAIPTRHEGDPK